MCQMRADLVSAASVQRNLRGSTKISSGLGFRDKGSKWTNDGALGLEMLQSEWCCG